MRFKLKEIFMETKEYYHGSSVLFDSFSLEYLASGSGVRFGVGVYLTEAFDTAAHYSEPRHASAEHHYVYTVEVPKPTEDNCLPYYGVPVPRGIIERVEAVLEESLPDIIKGSGRDADGKGVSLGKLLRKYIAHRCSGTPKESLTTEAQIDAATTIDAEVQASKFLLEVGVLFIEWPQGAWSKYPNCKKNIAVLDPSLVKIVQVEEVDLDEKAKYKKNSRRPIGD